MKILGKIFKAIFFFGSIAVFIYYFHVPLETGLARLEVKYFPCVQPIRYSIGTFDTRFGISQKTFLGAIQSAEAIWENPVGKELFMYDPAGKLKINLIYDDRQAATAKLQKLGITVNNDQATYNKVKAKYDALMKNHELMRTILDRRIAAFEAKNKAHNNEVTELNQQGGAPPETYTRLSEEENALREEFNEIKKLQDDFNVEVGNINATVDVLNRLAADLHLAVNHYNSLGEEHGGEFTEGEYVSGPEGMSINVYQFDDQSKLKRVLAHELGHALGLEHVEDAKAIMYRLNNGVNEKLTATDLTLVKNLCGIK